MIVVVGMHGEELRSFHVSSHHSDDVLTETKDIADNIMAKAYYHGGTQRAMEVANAAVESYIRDRPKVFELIINDRVAMTFDIKYQAELRVNSMVDHLQLGKNVCILKEGIL